MVVTDAEGDAVVARRPPREDGSGRSEEDAVLSEMHLETVRSPSDDGLYMSSYAIAGEDGPLLVQWHRLATPLATVGCQVWRGAALIADYVLANATELQGATVVELGSGPGLGALAAARAGAATVFATDIAAGGVLELCHRNIIENKLQDIVRARELDWMAPPGWLAGDGAAERGGGGKFAWTAADVDLINPGAGPLILLAADTIYDNDLTEAFMGVAERLLSLTSRPLARLIVALERRECFTMREMDVTAPAYDYWCTMFGEGRALRGRRLDAAAVPQLLQGYARADTLELWILENACKRVT